MRKHGQEGAPEPWSHFGVNRGGLIASRSCSLIQMDQMWRGLVRSAQAFPNELTLDLAFSLDPACLPICFGRLAPMAIRTAR